MWSCKEDVSAPAPAEVALVLSHRVEGQALEWDQIRYQNRAGNRYSLSRLEYYLSGFTLTTAEGANHAFPALVYVNAREAAVQPLAEMALPPGHYLGLTFFIGLPPEQNCSSCLPPTRENMNMAWPDGMGGGYHFLKLEGRYIGQHPDPLGYALHLGTNACLVRVRIDQPFELTSGNQQLLLQMDLQEWFQNPLSYDLDADGNYSMGNALLMQMLTQNGQDVFSFSIQEQEP